MEVLVVFLFFLLGGAQGSIVTITNYCPETVWPAISSNPGSPTLSQSDSGFELPSKALQAVNPPAGWSGRIWARTYCSNASTRNLTCLTGDCRTGTVFCGALPTPPVTYVELNLGTPNGNNGSYLVSVAAGFNVPASVLPPLGKGCTMASCPEDVNGLCLPELRVVGDGQKVIACMGACQALGDSEDCCTGNYSGRANCKPTKYNELFKRACPMAMSYFYDDRARFSCVGGSNYLITFCPVLGV